MAHGIVRTDLMAGTELPSYLVSVKYAPSSTATAIDNGFIPPVIFMGVGAMTDFGPMLRNLKLAIFGAAAQVGIFGVILVAIGCFGFTPQEAGSHAYLYKASASDGFHLRSRRRSVSMVSW